MTKRLLVLFVLFCALIGAGNRVVNRGSAPPPSYIFNLDFEGTGTPSGWSSGAGINYDYSADPLEGSDSLRITGPSTYAYASVSNTELWGKMKVRVGALGANNVIMTLINSGFTTRMQIAVLAGGALYVTGGGASAQTTDTMSGNTEYFVWWHFDGADVISVEFSTTDSRVGSGNKFASTTGTNDTITTIFLYCDASTTVDFDNVLIDDADIP